jgi:hypothetical protein
VRTERVITEDILSERLSRTLGIGARFLAEEAFIPEVCREKLSLTRKLAARLSVQTFDGELIYHLRKVKLLKQRGRLRLKTCANMPNDWVT